MTAAGWIITPLIGAAIGYITNSIAVKMLFRPLSEKHFAGRRIPFTPGIIPKNRSKLSSNIAEMVERELLSEDVIRSRCSKKEFRSIVNDAVIRIIDKILPVGNLIKIFLKSSDSKVITRTILDSISDSVIDEIPRIASSINIKQTVKDRIDAMNIEQVESIVLNIMADQFRMINIFGAVLGALIGLAEASATFFLFQS